MEKGEGFLLGVGGKINAKAGVYVMTLFMEFLSAKTRV
jgi:hypothetical protein